MRLPFDNGSARLPKSVCWPAFPKGAAASKVPQTVIDFVLETMPKG